MRVFLWSVVSLLLIHVSAVSQFQAPPDSLPTITEITPEDSVRIVGSMNKLDHDSDVDRTTKSPGLALLFSGVLPGAGQFYNESYWKVPILLGFGYYFASRWIDNNDSTKHYRDLYAGSITAQNTGGNSRLLQLREFYKDQRDVFSWYIFIYYFVNLIDAYVDASLYDFNVGDDLSIQLLPSVKAGPVERVGLNMKLRF